MVPNTGPEWWSISVTIGSHHPIHYEFSKQCNEVMGGVWIILINTGEYGLDHLFVKFENYMVHFIDYKKFIIN